MTFRSDLIRLACAALITSHTVAAQAGATRTDIHSFTGKDGDGDSANGGLLAGPGGLLYGVSQTYDPASPVNDLVFQLSPPSVAGGTWTYTDIYDFPRGGKDAGLGYEQAAIGPLASDSTGALYGVTQAGGPVSRGSVYRLIPPGPGQTHWTNQEIYGFKFGADGGYPTPVTVAGGAVYGFSTVISAAFRLTPPAPGQTSWQFTLIYQFPSPVSLDSAPIVRYVNGTPTLFGQLSNSLGGVFQLTAPAPPATAWTYSAIHTFESAYADYPLIADRSLNLYGLYNNVAFRLSPPGPGQAAWAYSVLHTFGGPDDAQGFTTPLEDYGGVLYGGSMASSASRPGSPSLGGTLFKITPRDPGGKTLPWSESLVYQFPHDTFPSGTLVLDASNPDLLALEASVKTYPLDNTVSRFVLPQ